MKEIKSIKKTGLIKKVLIKICRIFGYELIDQSTLEFPVSKKNYQDLISVPGNKSITLGAKPIGGVNHLTLWSCHTKIAAVKGFLFVVGPKHLAVRQILGV